LAPLNLPSMDGTIISKRRDPFCEERWEEMGEVESVATILGDVRVPVGSEF
jgi:hypothetical protein